MLPNSNTTGLPRNEANVTDFPSMVVARISGAGSPNGNCTCGLGEGAFAHTPRAATNIDAHNATVINNRPFFIRKLLMATTLAPTKSYARCTNSLNGCARGFALVDYIGLMAGGSWQMPSPVHPY